MDTKLILLPLVVLAISYTILYLSNYRNEDKYNQLFIPIIAIFISGIGWLIWVLFSKIILEKVEQVFSLNNFPSDNSLFNGLLFSAFVILLFSLIKLAFKLALSGLSLRFFESFAYKRLEGNKFGLKGRWAVAQDISKNLVIILLIATAFSIIKIFFLSSFTADSKNSVINIFIPGTGLSFLGLLVALEMKWYLKADVEMIPDDDPTSEVETEEIQADQLLEKVEDLKKRYKDIWNPFLLVDYYCSFPVEDYRENLEVVTDIPLDGVWVSAEKISIKEDLERGEDLIIKKVIYDEIAPIVFTFLSNKLKTGDNIVFILTKNYDGNVEYYEEVKLWINDWLKKIIPDGYGIDIFSRGGKVQAPILLAHPEELLLSNLSESKDWYRNVSTLIVMNGSKILTESMNSINVITHIFHSLNPGIQTIFLSDIQEDMEPATVRNLKIKPKPRERDTYNAPPEQCHAMVWKHEGDQSFQSQVLTAHAPSHLGEETILGLLPWSLTQDEDSDDDLFKPILLNQEKSPWDEYLEEIDRCKSTNSFDHTIIDLRKIKKVYTDYLYVPKVPYLIDKKDRTVLFIKDTEFNLVTAYDKWKDYGDELVFMHIVSPPYLLREYFAQNLHYFSKNPIYPLSSKAMLSKFQYAIKLLYRLIQQEMTENDILENISNFNKNAKYVKDDLINLFKDAFHIDLRRVPHLIIENQDVFDRQDLSFHKQTTYRLSSKIRENTKLKFLERIDIKDIGGNLISTIPRDFLFQNYLPHQVHSFNKKPFKIIKFKDALNVLSVARVRADRQIDYRPDLEVSLYKASSLIVEEQIQDFVKIKLLEGRFDVQTNGFYSFTEGISYDKRSNYKYQPLTEEGIPLRSYTLGRYLQFEFMTDRIQEKFPEVSIPKLLITLSVLVKEISYTFYPYSFQYLIAGINKGLIGNLNEEEIDSQDEVNELDEEMIPTSIISNFGQRGESETDLFSNSIYLFEDAHQDLGLIPSVLENFKYIFTTILDYLTWLEDKSAGKNDRSKLSSESINFGDINKGEFLKFGSDKVPYFLDLEGTKQVLSSIYPNNQITVKRRNFFNS